MTTRPTKTLGDWVAEIEQHMTPVPHRTVDFSCATCHGFRDGPQAQCSSCHLTMNQVTQPLDTVVPISMTTGYTQLHHILRSYKSEYTVDTERRLMQVRMSAALTWLLGNHSHCLGSWDYLAVVPSTRRPPPHPLEAVVGRSPRLRDSLYSPLEVTSTAPEKRLARDSGYRTNQTVDGDRVLLIDDTFTSGASLQSAASRLTLDGADVVGAVVFGRFVNPERSNNQEHLETQENQAFDWTTCCLH